MSDTTAGILGIFRGIWRRFLAQKFWVFFRPLSSSDFLFLVSFWFGVRQNARFEVLADPFRGGVPKSDSLADFINFETAFGLAFGGHFDTFLDWFSSWKTLSTNVCFLSYLNDDSSTPRSDNRFFKTLMVSFWRSDLEDELDWPWRPAEGRNRDEPESEKRFFVGRKPMSSLEFSSCELSVFDSKVNH